MPRYHYTVAMVRRSPVEEEWTVSASRELTREEITDALKGLSVAGVQRYRRTVNPVANSVQDIDIQSIFPPEKG